MGKNFTPEKSKPLVTQHKKKKLENSFFVTFTKTLTPLFCAKIQNEMALSEVTPYKQMELDGRIREPMLQETKSRFVLFPIEEPAMWKMYKKQRRVFGPPKKSICHAI